MGLTYANIELVNGFIGRNSDGRNGFICASFSKSTPSNAPRWCDYDFKIAILKQFNDNFES
jgi:hypothetical protein